MKKINLNLTKNLSEKKLSETQMDELLGGLKCPYCGYDFEPNDMGPSNYGCIGYLNGEMKYLELYEDSLEEAVAKVESWGYTNVYCVPGRYYNTPGF